MVERQVEHYTHKNLYENFSVYPQQIFSVYVNFPPFQQLPHTNRGYLELVWKKASSTSQNGMGAHLLFQ
jgi:hypothetical protein